MLPVTCYLAARSCVALSLSFAEGVVEGGSDAWGLNGCFCSVNRSGETTYMMVACSARSWSSHPSLQASSSLLPEQTGAVSR